MIAISMELVFAPEAREMTAYIMALVMLVLVFGVIVGARRFAIKTPGVEIKVDPNEAGGPQAE